MSRTPLLSFEFADSDGKIVPFTFENPLQIVVANTIEEVLPCLERIEEAVKNGYYAAGFLSYESAPAFDAAFRVNKGGTMPLLWFGIFSEPAHRSLSGTDTYELTGWTPSVTTDEYHTSIEAIKDAIENGESYQANYTLRLHSTFKGDPIAFFEKLKRAQASNYCAFIDTGYHSILSASPELFFHKKGTKITTRPMKGTIKRGRTYTEDLLKADWLYHSEKNRAENVMIVDLLRNDLGVIAVPGTVEVPKLFEIEHYPTVHQMTSTITAEVPEEIEFAEIFKALFPCGSITGAPKISTMDLIAELETTPREVYCGAIGFITPEREAVFNVPIRTVLIDHASGNATYGVGGGITWDSTTTAEYQEVLAKARLLEVDRPRFQLLESLLVEDGRYFLMGEHLERLKNSADYFGYQLEMDKVRNELQSFAQVNCNGKLKVRLLVDEEGDIVVEGQPIAGLNAPLTVKLAEKPVDSSDVFLYHKTTNRTVYEQFLAGKPANILDVLLWNEDGEITEFTNGNVVVEINGILVTPPVECGLLAGTFRETLLKTGVIQERIVTVKEMYMAEKLWLINSVRKWIEVKILS